MDLVLTTDTHVPARARQLPAELLGAIGAADVVFHAGDWVDEATLDLLAGRARRLVAVHGNNDGPGLRARLPEVAWAEVGGVRFAVVHETGAARGREGRCEERFRGVDVLVFGHSHIPWDTTAARGAAAAQSRVAHRPAPAAVLHLHDGDRGGRRPLGRRPAPAAAPPARAEPGPRRSTRRYARDGAPTAGLRPLPHRPAHRGGTAPLGPPRPARPAPDMAPHRVARRTPAAGGARHRGRCGTAPGPC